MTDVKEGVPSLAGMFRHFPRDGADLWYPGLITETRKQYVPADPEKLSFNEAFGLYKTQFDVDFFRHSSRYVTGAERCGSNFTLSRPVPPPTAGDTKFTELIDGVASLVGMFRHFP